jgi:hypothetical protein
VHLKPKEKGARSRRKKAERLREGMECAVRERSAGRRLTSKASFTETSTGFSSAASVAIIQMSGRFVRWGNQGVGR